MALPPAPCFKSRFPIKHTRFIPGGARAAPFCAASPFHIALVVRGCAAAFHSTKPSPLQGALGEGRGLLPGNGLAAGLLLPLLPPTAPIPGQQLPGRGNTERRAGQAYAECIVNTIHLKVMFPGLYDPSFFLALHL